MMRTDNVTPISRAADVPRIASPEAEAAILGAIMYAPEHLPEVAALVGTEDFSVPGNQMIWNTIQQLDAERNDSEENIDLLTVSERLASKGVLDSVGGLSTLVAMVRNTPSAENVVAYARIVRDKFLLQRIAELSAETAVRAGTAPAGESAALLADLTHRLDELSAVTESEMLTAPQRTDGFLDDLARRMDAAENGKITGLTSGYCDYDMETSGLHPGGVTVVAGRPGMGKTTWALGVALRTVLDGKRALVITCEMSDLELTQRLASAHSSIPFSAIRDGQINDTQFRQIEDFATWLHSADNLLIADRNVHKIGQIETLVKALHRRQRLHLVVIDYLQLLSGDRTENRNQEVGEISRRIKHLARTINVPVILVSQLNRLAEGRSDKRPNMGDLRDSGQIEQDADVIALLYRDEYYNPDTTEKGAAEVQIAKHRQGEEVTLKLRWEGGFCRFSDYIPDRSMSGEIPFVPPVEEELKRKKRGRKNGPL
ncbi:MAG: replicative DNA helicase [Candidatus Thiodiazotropha sp.]